MTTATIARRFIAALPGLLLMLCTPAAAIADGDPLSLAVQNLATQPWSLKISAEIRQPSTSEPDTTVRRSNMAVSYNPQGGVTLALGSIRIHAEPGLLTAVHTGNPGVVYRAKHPGLDTATILERELPPLWCPWLAFALTGDRSAWLLVGKPEPGISWREPTTLPTGDPAHAVIRYTGMRTTDNARITAEIDPSPSPRLRRVTVHIPRDRRPLEMVFSAEKTDPVTVPPDPPGGRTHVASIASLLPPPPGLQPGDRLPPVHLSVYANDDLAVRPWQPTDVFIASGDNRSPVALVLVLTRPGPHAAHRLERIARLIRPARLRSGVTGVIARPSIATNIDTADLAALTPLRRAWRRAYSPDITIPYAEKHTPAASWAPAPALLDRLAPDADAAILVIDRSGWIVAVHGENASAEEIAESIKTAAR